MLELAILGLLHEAPAHGYELRKRLGLRLGLRLFSYGSLYPALRRLVRVGLIVEDPGGSGEPCRPRRRVYRITAAGHTRLGELLTGPGPRSWADDAFGVHLAFFACTPPDARMRILQGRRRAVQERCDGLRSALSGCAGPACADRYTRELHQLGLDAGDREMRWLDGLIAAERSEQCPARGEQPGPATPPRTTTSPSTTEGAEHE